MIAAIFDSCSFEGFFFSSGSDDDFWSSALKKCKDSEEKIIASSVRIHGRCSIEILTRRHLSE